MNQWQLKYYDAMRCLSQGHNELIKQHNKSMVSCQKGPTHHAYAWQIGPFWQDTLEMKVTVLYQEMSYNIMPPWTTLSLNQLALICRRHFQAHIVKWNFLCNKSRRSKEWSTAYHISIDKWSPNKLCHSWGRKKEKKLSSSVLSMAYNRNQCLITNLSHPSRHTTQ